MGQGAWKPNPRQVTSSKPCPSQTAFLPNVTPSNKADREEKSLTRTTSITINEWNSVNGPGTSHRCHSHSLCQGEWHSHGPKELIRIYRGKTPFTALVSQIFILFSSEPEMSELIADSLFHNKCTVIGQGNKRKCHL